MKKRAYIVHGWEGTPQEGWFPWLKERLQAKGFEVVVPQMPEANNPKIGPWVAKLQETITEPDSQTILIGHSIGCQAIMRYLELLPVGVKIGRCVFVAGFFKLKWLEADEEWEVAKPWLETPLDTKKILTHCSIFKTIFSDNDQFVSVDQADDFKKRLQAEVVMLHQRKHFSGSENTFELPEAFDACIT